MEEKMTALRAEKDEVEKRKKLELKNSKKNTNKSIHHTQEEKRVKKSLELLCQDLHLIEGETVKFQQNPGDIAGIPDTIVFGPEDRKLLSTRSFPLLSSITYIMLLKKEMSS